MLHPSCNQANWSSRQLAAIMLVIRTSCLVLSTITWMLNIASLIFLRDKNADELYRCFFLALVTAFGYMLTAFTPQTPPPHWRLTWCISAIVQAIVYNAMLLSAQLRRSERLIDGASSVVNLVAVVFIVLTSVFIAIDAVLTYRTYDKVVREPLLKHFLQNRVFIRDPPSLRSPSRRPSDVRSIFRRRQATVQPGRHEGTGSEGGETAAGTTAGTGETGDHGRHQDRHHNSGHNLPPAVIVVTGGGDSERELRERQRQMLRQQVRAQQREHWFLSPLIVTSPDFNVVDYTNVALDPLPVYEPMASGSNYVLPNSSSLSLSSVLPMRPLHSATSAATTTTTTTTSFTSTTAAPETTAMDGHAPPSYDDLPLPETSVGSEMYRSYAHGSAIAPPPQASPPQATMAGHHPAPPSSSVAPPPSQQPPLLHEGQLPPAYDDIDAPPSSTAHPSEQPTEAARIPY